MPCTFIQNEFDILIVKFHWKSDSFKHTIDTANLDCMRVDMWEEWIVGVDYFLVERRRRLRLEDLSCFFRFSEALRDPVPRRVDLVLSSSSCSTPFSSPILAGDAAALGGRPATFPTTILRSGTGWRPPFLGRTSSTPTFRLFSTYFKQICLNIFSLKTRESNKNRILFHL